MDLLDGFAADVNAADGEPENLALRVTGERWGWIDPRGVVRTNCERISNHNPWTVPASISGAVSVRLSRRRPSSQKANRTSIGPMSDAWTASPTMAGKVPTAWTPSVRGVRPWFCRRYRAQS
jgi:hypothetical protein